MDKKANFLLCLDHVNEIEIKPEVFVDSLLST